METALAWIGKLYAVEKDLRERCQGQWQGLSLEEARPADRGRAAGPLAAVVGWLPFLVGSGSPEGVAQE